METPNQNHCYVSSILHKVILPVGEKQNFSLYVPEDFVQSP